MGMCSAAEEDLYAVLGANQSDSAQQLRSRYQQLALQYHPDRVGGVCSSQAESAVEKFLQVSSAWKILSDPDSRRQYDLHRRAQELKQDWPVDSTVYLKDMTWDQEGCVYRSVCRCGGVFSVSSEEVEETQQDEGEENGGIEVCCDTCSLCVLVTWTQTKTHITK